MDSDPCTAIAERLRARVVDALDAQPAAWLRAQLDALAVDVEPARLLAAYAGVGRRLRDCSLPPDPRLFAAAAAAGLPGLADWDAARTARVVLVRTALGAADPATHVELVHELHRTGDNREREALLGALSLLPEPERFREIAIDACRSNVENVFAAIACDNAYAARYFDEASFNQMVLKAVFVGLRLARVVGLRERCGSELARMARDFANERRAAGRSVPEDLDLISSIHAGGGADGDA
jgi:hypothetical protein